SGSGGRWQGGLVAGAAVEVADSGGPTIAARRQSFPHGHGLRVDRGGLSVDAAHVLDGQAVARKRDHGPIREADRAAGLRLGAPPCGGLRQLAPARHCPRRNIDGCPDENSGGGFAVTAAWQGGGGLSGGGLSGGGLSGGGLSGGGLSGGGLSGGGLSGGGLSGGGLSGGGLSGGGISVGSVSAAHFRTEAADRGRLTVAPERARTRAIAPVRAGRVDEAGGTFSREADGAAGPVRAFALDQVAQRLRARGVKCVHGVRSVVGIGRLTWGQYAGRRRPIQ